MTQIFLVAPGAGLPDSVARFRPTAFREALASAGYDVQLFTTRSNSELPDLRHRLVENAAREKPLLVLISAGPFTWLPRLISAFERRNIPFALDFRDGWSANMLSRPFARFFKFPVARNIEKRLMRASLFFVTCTHGLLEYYRQLADDSSKVHLVLNGHSVPEHLSSIAQRRPPFSESSANLCILGKFFYYDMRGAVRLMEATHREADLASVDVRFTVVGEPTIDRIWRRLPDSLRSSITVIPPVPYQEALNIVADCDAGLAFLRDPQFDYGTKIFDFIALGRPVISNAPKYSPAYRFFSPYLFTSLKSALSLQAPHKVPLQFSRAYNSQALLTLLQQYTHRAY
jgi:hypothetical protein